MDRLTEREKEVLSTVINHKAYNLAKIDSILFIEKSTSQTHLKNIYEKWDVHSKAEMIDFYYRQKINKIKSIIETSLNNTCCDKYREQLEQIEQILKEF